MVPFGLDARQSLPARTSAFIARGIVAYHAYKADERSAVYVDHNLACKCAPLVRDEFHDAFVRAEQFESPFNDGLPAGTDTSLFYGKSLVALEFYHHIPVRVGADISTAGERREPRTLRGAESYPVPNWRLCRNENIVPVLPTGTVGLALTRSELPGVPTKYRRHSRGHFLGLRPVPLPTGIKCSACIGTLRISKC